MYEMDLPSSLSSIHLVFYVSMLRKCLSDSSQILPIKDIGILDSLSYEEVLVEILD